jgi:5'-methylthioadenosine phosphorylase
LAILGGSGLYEIDGLADVQHVEVDTPFGPPSDAVVCGRLGATRLVFLPRHGRGHRIAPHEINYRANICAAKKLGATHLVSLSAVGSLREDIAPGDFVVVDQFVDLTRRRASTFFEDGIVGHVAFGDPVCRHLSDALTDAARRSGKKVHPYGTYVCIEGPQFSTRAESLLFRSWGMSVIGMTAMPEAKLAREAELPYALLALATDYDCWRVSEDDVTVDAVVAVMKNNVTAARQTLTELVRMLPDPSKSVANGALRGAIMTDRTSVQSSVRSKLDWLIARHYSDLDEPGSTP